MTALEQSTQLAAEAAKAGDLDQLKGALQDRASAIDDAVNQPASSELAARLYSAIADGERIRASIAAFRGRTIVELARLGRLKASLRSCSEPPSPARISCRG